MSRIKDKLYEDEVPTKCLSDIQKFYDGSTIFITGATGFLGQVLLFKLLTSCSGVRTIYILVRGKANTSPSERFEQLFPAALKEKLTAVFPDYREKIKLIEGDCMQPGLGMNESDLATLIDKVEIVFHVAATVRFNAPLSDAVQMNVRCTRDLLNIAKIMKRLKVFAHVSTAFSNCAGRTEIMEEFYDPPISPRKLLTLVKELDAEIIDKVTPHLLNSYANTYVYTKAVAEAVCRSHWHELPVFIYRPAIVISSAKEPIPGWINNLNGPTGIVLATAVGLLRSIQLDEKKITNIVPCDYVINCLLASACEVGRNWKKQRTNGLVVAAAAAGVEEEEEKVGGNSITSSSSSSSLLLNGAVHDADLCSEHKKAHPVVRQSTNWNVVEEEENELLLDSAKPINGNEHFNRIYHFSSSALKNPMTWRRFIDINLMVEQDYPFSAAFRPVSFTLNKYRFMHHFYCVFFHLIPAFFIDAFNKIRGVDSKLLSQYSKVHKLVDMVSPFSTNNWIMHNTNVQHLWSKLSDRDKEIFEFNMDQLDWHEYLKNQLIGLRVFMMNDALDTVPKAKKNKVRLLWIYRSFMFLFWLGLIQFIFIKFF